MNQFSNELHNLYIGDNSISFARAVKELHPGAILITDENLLDILNSGVESAYTSVGDLGHYAWGSEFKQLLDTANNIAYISSDLDNTNELSIIDHTKLLLENYRLISNRTIAGLESVVDHYRNSFLSVIDCRKTINQQIWAVGCSNTNGIGYVEVGQRYGDLLAKELNLPVTFLSKNGTSIAWAADQILRADLQPGDVVFWGITHHSRIPYHNRNGLIHVNTMLYSLDRTLKHQVPVSDLDNFNLLYKNVTSIHQVISRCRSANVQLFMLDLLPNPLLTPFLYGLDNYDQGVDYYGKFVDFGYDGEHAGPQQHKIFANKLLTMYHAHNKQT